VLDIFAGCQNVSLRRSRFILTSGAAAGEPLMIRNMTTITHADHADNKTCNVVVDGCYLESNTGDEVLFIYGGGDGDGGGGLTENVIVTGSIIRQVAGGTTAHCGATVYASGPGLSGNTYAAVRNVLIEGNIFDFDAVTYEGFRVGYAGNDKPAEDIVVRGNIIRASTPNQWGAVMLWAADTDTGLANVILADNVLVNTGATPFERGVISPADVRATGNVVSGLVTYQVDRSLGLAPTAITTKATLTITSISAGATAIVGTSAVHGCSDGDWVFFAGTNSTPPIDGWRQVGVLNASALVVAVDTTGGAGNAGSAQPAYTNRDNYDEDVVVVGGTVTKIELTANGGTNWTDISMTAGIFGLRPGDSICITNSFAPTTTKVPRA